MSTDRDHIEKRVRTLLNDLNPHQHAISARIMAELIEEINIELTEELPFETIRTPGAITLTTGAQRVLLQPQFGPPSNPGGVSSIAAIIIDSINKPLQQKSLAYILDLETGQFPPKGTYPYFFAVEEQDFDQSIYIHIWPQYSGPGDTLTTILAPSGQLLNFGTSVVSQAVQGQLCLALRVACDCLGRMTDEQLASRKLSKESLLDPNNPRSWIARADNSFKLESARLWMMDSAGDVTQYGRL